MAKKKAKKKPKKPTKAATQPGSGNQNVGGPGGSTTIIVRPVTGDLTFEMDGAPTTPVDPNTDRLNPAVFTRIVSVSADVKIGPNTVVYAVKVGEISASLVTPQGTKLFKLQAGGTYPRWWLGGTELLAYAGHTKPQWNDDLTNAFSGGTTLSAKVMVKTAGNPPSEIACEALSVTIVFE